MAVLCACVSLWCRIKFSIALGPEFVNDYIINLGSSEERGAFSRNATKTWVEGADLLSVCREAPLSSLVPIPKTQINWEFRIKCYTGTPKFKMVVNKKQSAFGTVKDGSYSSWYPDVSTFEKFRPSFQRRFDPLLSCYQLSPDTNYRRTEVKLT